MQEIKEYVKEQKEILKNKIKTFKSQPVFHIIQIGEVEASNRYVRNKIKDCEEVGIKTELFKLPENISKDELKCLVDTLNSEDNSVDAIMVQFPLPKHLDEKEVMSWINPKKDADGFTNNGITNPATPQGIITYLERQGYDFENKNALVIGRSEIVGKPMARLLLEKNCNVTVIHSKTGLGNKSRFVESADLIICATGSIGTLTNDYVYAYNRKGIVFDVGINFDENGKLVGDCVPNLTHVAFQSPVPGGVGLLTRLQLLENVVKLYEERHNGR